MSVDLQSIRFSDPSRGLRYVYLTPRIAQEALILFDEGRPVPPFECRLARASQIVAMYRRRPGGGRAKAVDLGPKRVQLEDGGRGTPTVIGGRTPPFANFGGSVPREGIKKGIRKAFEAAGTSTNFDDITAADMAEQGRRMNGRPRSRREYGMRAFKIGSLLPGRA